MSGELVPENDLPTTTAQNVAPAGNEVPENDLPTDYETPGQLLKTAAESTARGATLGGSDVVETKLLGVKPEDIQGRMEANPGTSMAGNVLGTTGLISLTGGLAAPVEAAATAAKVGTTAARVIGMGVEGGVIGAGNAVTDYALGDPNLNAQKILADIGMGAAFGGGLGALSKGVEVALPAGANLVKKGLGKLADTAQNSIEGLSGDWAAQLKLAGQEPEPYIRKMSDTLEGLHSASKDAAKELYETTLPNNIKAAIKDIPVERSQQQSFDLYSKLEGLVNKMKSDPETFAPAQVKMANQVVSDLQNDLVGAKSSYDVFKGLHDFGKDISKGIKYDKLPTFSQQAVQGTMREMNDSVRGFLKDPNVWGEDAASHFSQVSDAYNQLTTARKNFESDFMSKEYTPSGARKVTMNPGKVNTFFNNIQEIGQDLRNQHLNDFLTATKNLSDITENSLNYHAAKESIADRISSLAKTHEELKDVAKIMSKRSPEGGLFKEAVGASVLSSLGFSHPAVAGIIGSIEALKNIKNPYALGLKLNRALNVTRAIGSITQATGNRMSGLIRGVFSPNPLRSGLISGGVSSSYDKRVDRIKQLSSNPDMLIKHLDKSTNAMYDAAPNVSNGIHNAMTAGLQFLEAKIPQPPGNYPLSEDYEPSPAQKDAFDRYYDTVNDPLTALSSIKDGSFSNEQLETLQAVYPHLLTEMRSQVMQSLSKAKTEDISYATKISLSKFLGMPLDASMTPQAVLSNQSAFLPPQGQQPSQGAPKAPKSTLGGLKELDVAKRRETQTQDLEKLPA